MIPGRPAPEARDPESGVTLVEMLVALAICALIGVAGFAMLDTILRVDRRTEGNLDRFADLDRAFLVVGRDIIGADAARLRLDEAGLALATRTRDGRAQVLYRVEDGAFLRRTGAAAVDQTLLRDVSEARWRVLDGARRWHEAWPPEEAGSVAPASGGLELRLEMSGPQGGVVRRVFRATPGAVTGAVTGAGADAGADAGAVTGAGASAGSGADAGAGSDS